MAIDDNIFHSFDKMMDLVMVELDISLGLPAELDIFCGKRVFTQQLDKLKIPFRCHLCTNAGQFKNKFPKLLHGRGSSEPESY